MNKHQRIAIERHCRLSGEVLNDVFAYTEGLFRYKLTVNSGYE